MKLDPLRRDSDEMRDEVRWHADPSVQVESHAVDRSMLQQPANDFDPPDSQWPTSAAPPPPAASSKSCWSRARQPDDDPIELAASRRQRNPAPWLAAGLMAIALVALVAGLLGKERVDAEATRTVDRRAATERAVALLGGPSGMQPQPITKPSASAARAPGDAASIDPAPPPITDAASDRERHQSMLSAIKAGSVLASLPPTALAQPSSLPAELPPVSPSAAAGSRPAKTALPVPKRVALDIEGPRAALTAQSPDPLAAATVSASLKDSAVPHHRVYQLRESEGEWLGYVAHAEADPIASGVWAGAGDLLPGGWRVADVTSQRLTLVGPRGALEILRP